MPQNLPNGEYKVDLDKLDSTTDKVQSLEDLIDTHKDEVKAAVALLAQDWKGTAASQALAKFSQWDEDARKVHEGVRTMREAARNAHDNYSGALETNLRMLRGE